ncbi:MAG: 4Fe-4S dicluster domain-containing protein [Gammaproteobacteria bacterium]|nr:4Fe-4S dicluster domain-containing protein [Gammaproteobacteria bacterium]
MADGVRGKVYGRRRFLKQLGQGTAAAAALAYPHPRSPHAATAKNPQVRYAMVIDTRRCVGCHACSVACKAEFDVPLGFYRSWVEYVEKGTFPDVRRSFLPRLCNQCSNPPCVDVCPTGATWQREEDGIVEIDPDICIGCKYCILACPYDARFANPVTGTAEKCDFCLHRVRNGLEPACVETCIGRARIFGDLNDPNSEVGRLLATTAVTVLRQEMGTKPNVYYIAADHTGEGDARAGQYVRVTTHRRQKDRR